MSSRGSLIAIPISAPKLFVSSVDPTLPPRQHATDLPVSSPSCHSSPDKPLWSSKHTKNAEAGPSRPKGLPKSEPASTTSNEWEEDEFAGIEEIDDLMEYEHSEMSGSDGRKDSGSGFASGES
jgi:hypothetical protein